MAFGVALSRLHRAGLGATLSRMGRATVLDELERLMLGLTDPYALVLEVDADRASARLPTQIVVELVLESGEGRVDDVHE